MAQVTPACSGGPVAYAGDDLGQFKAVVREQVSAEMAVDLALIFDACQKIGALSTPGAADRLIGLLGGPLRTYRALCLKMAREQSSR